MMKQQHPKTSIEIIIESATQDYSSVITKKDAKEIIEYVVAMLTDEQTNMLAKKIQWCNYYKEMHDKGLSEKRIRSMISRKFGIRNNHTSWACDSCKVWIESIKK